MRTPALSAVMPSTRAAPVQVFNLPGKRPARAKFMTRVWGLSPPKPFVNFTANTDTVMKCITERVFFVKNSEGELVEPPKPREGIYDSLNYIVKHFEYWSRYTAPLTKEQFLGTYVGRKRRIYEDAFLSLESRKLTPQDAHIKFFLKSEKLPLKEGKETVPRGISPRSPRYNAHVGPYIKRVEKTVYKTINKLFGMTTICKGLNALERGSAIWRNWQRFDDPVAIGLDASRFDQHVSEDALLYEHAVYKTYFPYDKNFHNLLSWQINNKFKCYVGDTLIKFQRRGMRCSGDMNTALGNCLIMSSIVHSYCKTRFEKFGLVNDGDDCVLFIERKDLHIVEDLPQYFLDFGFTMKVEEPVFRMEDIEFCQSKPIFDGKSWIVVRDPRVCMAKDPMSHYEIPPGRPLRHWFHSVGECGTSLTGGIPVLQNFYRVMMNSGTKNERKLEERAPECGMEFLAQGMGRKFAKPSDDARVSYWRAFNLCPNRQIVLEEWLDNQHIPLDEYVDQIYVPSEIK